LREFESFKPINIWFQFPIHKLDDGILEDALPLGDLSNLGAGYKKVNKRQTAPEDKVDYKDNFIMCYESQKQFF
jgi:hypothetical protein